VGILSAKAGRFEHSPEGTQLRRCDRRSDVDLHGCERIAAAATA
jgi:hypothetical protein